MYSLARRTALAALLIVAVVAVFGAHAATYTLDGTTTSYPEMGLNGDMFRFVSMSPASTGVVVSISNADVTGAGVEFRGLDAADTEQARAISVRVANMRVIGTTVTISQVLPRNSDLRFTTTMGTSLNGPLFAFNFLTLVHNASLIIRDPRATWAAPAGKSLLLANGALTISDQSALFVEKPFIDTAIASVYTAGAGSALTQVTDSSVFAIDHPVCTLCTGPVVTHLSAVQVNQKSLYRVSAAQAGSGGIITGAIGATTNSVVEVSGGVSVLNAAYLPSSAPDIGSSARLMLGPLTGGGSIGTSFDTVGGTTYLSATSTLGSNALSTLNAWADAGVTGNRRLVDRNFKENGACVNVHCMGNANVLASGNTCSCDCSDTQFVPQCTDMYDPIEFTAECGPLPDNCLEFTTDCLCARCLPPSTLVNGACIPPQSSCDVPNCKRCCSVITSTCCECDIGYVLNPDTRLECVACSVRIPGCGGCIDWYTCGKCSPAYQVNGGTCIRRPINNGVSTVVQPTTMGVLLLLISSLAIYVG